MMIVAVEIVDNWPVNMGTLNIKWDPKNLEIRTKSVEKTLEPLVTQVWEYS